ncbi:MAG: dihydrofolate reductase [Planctomycetota bacterium]|jgi:dihydrofolate reductase
MTNKKPLISLIVAMDENNLIGKDGDLPWRLSADLKHFKRNTLGKPIVMGRKTWESIGRPLPKRPNIVVTSGKSYEAVGAIVVHSLEQAIDACDDAPEVMIIGGSSIYAAFLPTADRLYLTRVHAQLEGDTHFPAFDLTDWHELDREDHVADEKNAHDYSFLTLERKH